MICRKPFLLAGEVPFGCGQCLPCRVNKRRVWASRQLLESLTHEQNSFLTLTYDEEHHPADGSLSPGDLRLFLRRLRHSLRRYEVEYRFYAVGEYGDETMRPHYHASLFGIGPEWGEIINECWGKGFIQLSEFTPSTAQYVCGYVVKKLTDKSDPRLAGRHPEFARMSRHPGIGAPAVAVLAAALDNEHGIAEIEKTGDVPIKVLNGRKSLPLGRYLRGKLRETVGLSEEWLEVVKQDFFLQASQEVRTLRQAAQANDDYTSAATLLVEQNLQRIRNLESRFNSRKQRKTL